MVDVLTCAGAVIAAIHVLRALDDRLASIAAGKHLARAGDWSYGLYLIHVPILIAVCAAGAMLSAPAKLVFVVAFVVAGAGGLAFGWAEHSIYANHLRALANTMSASLTTVFQTKRVGEHFPEPVLVAPP
jgi:peptidoglycan/LPS O-acetylase OafA/YrhL